MKRITVNDVAKLAGVSASAVSRAFAPDPVGLIEETKRERVIAAARKLGYRPNAFARGLRTTRSRLVGILLEEFENPLFLRVFDALTRKLQEAGLHAITINASKDLSVRDAVSIVMEYRIEALVVASDMPLQVELECQKMGVPILVFGRSEHRRSGVVEISIDDEDVGRGAALHLVECGYRNAAYVGGFPDVSVSVDRLRGFTLGLSDGPLTLVHTSFAGNNTYGAGLAAARGLMAGATRPDCAFCVNDQVAIGVLDYLRGEAGVAVPEDFGVIGVDDLWFGATAAYRLTTIEQPIEAMADTFIRALQAVLAGEDTASLSRSFKATVLHRATTASRHRPTVAGTGRRVRRRA